MRKEKNTTKRKKYAYGGTGYMTPDFNYDLQKGQLDLFKKRLEAENKHKWLGDIGNIMLGVGNKMVGMGGTPMAGLLEGAGNITQNGANGNLDGKGMLMSLGTLGVDYGINALRKKYNFAVGGTVNDVGVDVDVEDILNSDIDDDLKRKLIEGGSLYNFDLDKNQGLDFSNFKNFDYRRNNLPEYLKITALRSKSGKPQYILGVDYNALKDKDGKSLIPYSEKYEHYLNSLAKEFMKNNKGALMSVNNSPEAYENKNYNALEKLRSHATTIVKGNVDNVYHSGQLIKELQTIPQQTKTQQNISNRNINNNKSVNNTNTKSNSYVNKTTVGQIINPLITTKEKGINVKSLKFSTGGIATNVPIEAEGQELIETPNGQLGEIQGPSHEKGGVPMEVPQDSVIYSKRLKGPDGRSMAKRKEFREKHLAKLEKLVKLNPKDKILKKTYEKTLKDFERQEQEDIEHMNYMNEISNETQEELPTMATGGNPPIRNYKKTILPIITQDNPEDLISLLSLPKQQMVKVVKPIDSPFKSLEDLSLEDYQINRTPTEEKMSFWDKVGNIYDKTKEGLRKGAEEIGDDIFPYTTGDILSMIGMYKSGTDPLKLTQEQRAGDTSNINFYKDYGKKGLQRLEETKNFLTQQHNENLADLITERDTAIARNRAGARGINTQRVLDLATDVQLNKAQNDAYMNYLNQVNQIMGMEANALNQIDQTVMRGEEARDLADRQDRDNFYTQLQRDTRYRNEMIQQQGQFLNNVKERQHTENMINSYSDKYIYKNGVIVGLKKDVEDPEFEYWKGATKGQQDAWNKMVSEKGYKFEDGVFYNDKGEEVDHLDKNFKVKKGGKRNTAMLEKQNKQANIYRNLYKNIFDGTDYTNEEVIEIVKNKDKLSKIKLSSGREVNMQDLDVDNSIDKDILEYRTTNGKRKINPIEYINRISRGEDLSDLIPVRTSDIYEEYKTNTFNGKVKTYEYDENGNVKLDKNGKKITKEVTYSNEKLNEIFKTLAQNYYEDTGKKFNPNNLNEETLDYFRKYLKKDEKLTKDDLIKLLLNIK